MLFLILRRRFTFTFNTVHKLQTINGLLNATHSIEYAHNSKIR